MSIAVITGASSGMGKEFVRLTMEDNIKYDEIWVIARRKERLEYWGRLYKEQRFRVLALDLGRKQDLLFLEEELKNSKPEISLFIHCAGFGIMGKINEISRIEQAEMVDVNCRSVVELTCLVLPYMEPGARMIYLASAAAFLPQPDFAVYAASKAFVLSFVRALSAELRQQRVKVTAVCPGAVRTEFFNRAAGSRHLPVYKKLVMADPEKVVRKAWKDSLKGRPISVYGKAMKLFRAAARVLPHSLFLRFL